MKTHLIALLFMAALPLAAQADRDFDRTVPAEGVKEVSITNVAGSVTVTGSDRRDIQVSGRLEDDIEEVEIVKDGGVLSIDVRLRDGKRSYHEGEAELEVSMPESLRLTVTATSADVTARGVRGAQRLKSVSGDIDAEAWTEPVEFNAVSGDISLDGHGEKSRVRMEAVSGDVMARRVGGTVTGESVSGDVIIRDSRLEEGRFETTSGDVLVRAGLASGGRFEAESVSGDVELIMDGEPDADFLVSSFSGRIKNCFGPKPERRSRYAPGSELHFTAGDGAGEVRVKTLSGDVEICTR